MELRGKYDTLQRSNEKETRGQGAVLLLKNTEIETLKKDLEKSIRGGEERGERWREKIDGMEKRYEGEIQVWIGEGDERRVKMRIIKTNHL